MHSGHFFFVGSAIGNRLHIHTTVSLFFRRYSCTVVQLYSCTVVQLYSFTVLLAMGLNLVESLNVGVCRYPFMAKFHLQWRVGRYRKIPKLSPIYTYPPAFPNPVSPSRFDGGDLTLLKHEKEKRNELLALAWGLNSIQFSLLLECSVVLVW